MKDFLKTVYEIIAMIFISVSAFGGGALYWIVFCILTGIEGDVAKIGCFVSMFFFSFLGFWLAPKFSDKYL